jgi:hypothetical protein
LLHELGHCSAGGKIFRDVRALFSPLILLTLVIIVLVSRVPVGEVIPLCAAWLMSTLLLRFMYGGRLTTEVAADVFAVAHSSDGDLEIVSDYLKNNPRAFEDERLGNLNVKRRDRLSRLISMRQTEPQRFSREWPIIQAALQCPLLPSILNSIAIVTVLYQSFMLGLHAMGFSAWKTILIVVAMNTIFIIIYLGWYGRAVVALTMITGIDIEGILNTSSWHQFKGIKISNRKPENQEIKDDELSPD